MRGNAKKGEKMGKLVFMQAVMALTPFIAAVLLRRKIFSYAISEENADPYGGKRLFGIIDLSLKKFTLRIPPREVTKILVKTLLVMVVSALCWALLLANIVYALVMCAKDADTYGMTAVSSLIAGAVCTLSMKRLGRVLKNMVEPIAKYVSEELEINEITMIKEEV